MESLSSPSSQPPLVPLGGDEGSVEAGGELVELDEGDCEDLGYIGSQEYFHELRKDFSSIGITVDGETHLSENALELGRTADAIQDEANSKDEKIGTRTFLRKLDKEFSDPRKRPPAAAQVERIEPKSDIRDHGMMSDEMYAFIHGSSEHDEDKKVAPLVEESVSGNPNSSKDPMLASMDQEILPELKNSNDDPMLSSMNQTAELLNAKRRKSMLKMLELATGFDNDGPLDSPYGASQPFPSQGSDPCMPVLGRYYKPEYQQQ